ncbi:MAG: DUF6265 family protein [Bacteroidota bacterium]
MKKALLLLLLMHSSANLLSQNIFEFLDGNWQIEGTGNIEHWNAMGTDKLQGLTYSLDNGLVNVSEYLKIERKGKKAILTATVLNQNQHQDVQFKMIYNDSAWIFQNKKHDFPQQVIYKKIDQNNIRIHLLGKASSISYEMRRLPEMHHMNNGGANPSYDENLANELGADDYGMKKFYFVLLESGPNTTTNKDSISEYFAGHMANIEKLVEEKKMIVAGPFGKNDHSFRGLFIFNNVENIKEVEELLKGDPAIKNKVLSAKIVEWYGSAALPLYLKYNDLIWKVKP